jgi:putative phosphonate metabolism protein
VSHAFVKDDAGKGEFMSYARFAIYYVPPEGPLAEFGAKWLGWDIVTGSEVPRFDLPGLHDITMTPRKYGFHGTLKPPFRLNDGQSLDALEKAVTDLAAVLSPAVCEGLTLTQLGRFLALTPFGTLDDLQRIAEACVRDLDEFRAPATEAELARRRKAGLSTRQEALLAQWGYPYVFEQFRFHLTLSGRLPEDELQGWTGILQDHLPELPTPFVIDQIALCGERQDGRFELIHRYTLTV